MSRIENTVLRFVLYDILFLLCCMPILVFSQQNKIVKATVVEADSKLPIPYATVLSMKQNSGTATDRVGFFEMEYTAESDSVRISAVGFTPIWITFSQLITDPIVELETQVNTLTEITVGAESDPAKQIWKKIIVNKKQNNPSRFEQYALNAHLNIHIKLINLQEKFVKSSMFKKHRALLEEQGDTGTVFTMPVYYNEKISNIFKQKSPSVHYAQTVFENTKGLKFFEDIDLLGYTDKMSLDVNFYENYIDVVERPFASPLHSNADSYYEFSLEDIFEDELGVQYTLFFRPKNTKDLLFYGSLTARESDWALTSVKVQTPDKSNLNFITRYAFSQTFKEVDGDALFFDKSIMDADFKLFNEEMPFKSNATAHVIKETAYSNINFNVKVGSSKEAATYFDKSQEQTIDAIAFQLEEADAKKEALQARIESINNIGAVKTIDKASKMLFSGYLEGKKIDYGPYLEFLKRNEVEGFRFNFTGRTNEQLWREFSLYGHVGYGTKDKEWKFGVGATYRIPGVKRRILDISYRDDLTNLGDKGSIFYIKENQLISGDDNIFSSLFSGDLLQRLHPEQRLDVTFENEWNENFSSKLKYQYKKLHANEFVPFTQNGNPVSSITTNEASVDTRFSYKEKRSDDYLRRYYLGSHYPIVHLIATVGQFDVNGNSDWYGRLRLVAKQDFNVGLTNVNTVLEAGKIWGDVPFPLLEFPRSDIGFGFSRYDFNLMNEAEYAVDEFISFLAEWHLNGYLFHRLPLLKKTKLREVLSFKGIVGDLSSSHNSILNLPTSTYPLSTNYMEFSAGIENIFQFFRMDAVWRLTDRDRPGTSNFGIRMRFDLKF